jgi:hypothetical protein
MKSYKNIACLLIISLLFNLWCVYLKPCSIHIGYSYILRKGYNGAILSRSSRDIVSNVDQVIIENGCASGITTKNEHFVVYRKKVFYFKSYEECLDFSSKIGMDINESKYIQFF